MMSKSGMINNGLQNKEEIHGHKKCLVKSFEENLLKLDKQELDLVIKKLSFLCLNYDPYDSDIEDEVENIINEYQLEEYTSNPFEFTNIVLQILDKTENIIKSRVH